MNKGIIYAAAIIVLAGTAAAMANEKALCVQQELTRLGFDPGPIDGSLGRKTLTAAKTYQQGAAYMPDLSADTTIEWCNRLRDAAALSLKSTDLPLTGSTAISGVPLESAGRATSILGETPEYKVPKWVNNPH